MEHPAFTILPPSGFVHPQALVESTSIGANTKIWAFSHVMPNVPIGENCNVGSHCFIETGASIGNNVTLKNNNMIFSGVTLEDGVFIAPSVVFTNDLYPRSPRLEQVKERYKTDDWLSETLVKEGATVGAGSVLIAGISVGAYSFVAAGAIVTKDVPDHALMVGQPAKQRGWVCDCGTPLKFSQGKASCEECNQGFEQDADGIHKRNAKQDQEAILIAYKPLDQKQTEITGAKSSWETSMNHSSTSVSDAAGSVKLVEPMRPWKLQRINTIEDDRWQDLLRLYPSSVFHSKAWMQVLKDTYGFNMQATILLEEGKPVAGMPFVQLDDLRGERVTMPFSDFCDPLVHTHDQLAALIDDVLSDNHMFTLRCLHNTLALKEQRLDEISKAKWHALNLKEKDLEGLWDQISGSARRGVRKARKEGIEVEVSQSKEAMRQFFEMHLTIRKYKYKLLAQPYRFFEAIWQQFMAKDKGAVFLAKHQGNVIGGILFLEWQGGLYYKFNASNIKHLDKRPNDLLIWEAISYAKEKNLAFLDFGLSDWDQEGLLRFKRKFASEEKSIHFLRHEVQKQGLKTNNAGQTLSQLTELLTQEDVPDTVTEKAGDLLYHNFA